MQSKNIDLIIISYFLNKYYAMYYKYRQEISFFFFGGGGIEGGYKWLSKPIQN